MRKKCLAIALAGAMVLSAAACGKTDAPGETVGQKEWVYVPEFINLEGDNISYYDMQIVGDTLCWTSWNWDEETETSSENICKYSLADNSTTSVPVIWPEGEENRNLSRCAFAEDGSMYSLVYSYSEDYSERWIFLVRFDPEGNLAFEKEITDQMEDPYVVESLVVDNEGRLYISGDGTVWLYDADANYQGSVTLDDSSMGSWIRDMSVGRDGRVYITYYGNTGNSSGYNLAAIDYDNRKFGDTYSGIPRGNGMAAGTDTDFLVNDGNKVYGYSLETQEKEELFTWLDSDINGNSVRSFGQMEDGRVIVIIEDWENDDRGVALLTRKKAEEVPQKEIILVGTMTGMYNLQSWAVKFNKSSDKYHISIKQYVDYDNYGENTWADAITSLNNDITSNNCPDIIDLLGVNIQQLVSKGVFEDLSGFLEKSSAISRSDFVENILNAYTYDGKLISVPASFEMQTVVGNAAQLGTESGWTLDEMIDYADQHPGAKLFDNTAKSEILQGLMMFNEEFFIDWSAGTCNFDSDAFKSLLKFVNRFDDEVNWSSDDASTPSKIQNGDVLLDQAYLYNFDRIQMYEEVFGNDGYVCIGFPTVDGKGGHAFMSGDAYAISAKSSHKDGAWAFIESILTAENGRYWDGFPTLKAKLDAMIEDATAPDYILDENGEIMLDDDGNPMVYGSGGSMSYGDGWTYEFHKPTQEDVDRILALMDTAKPISYDQNDEIITIISEEAEAFFSGQKSVDEVAGIIQNRLNIYVSENS